MSQQTIEMWNQSVFLMLNAGPQAPATAIAIARVLAGWTPYLAMVLLLFAWVRRGTILRFALLDATFSALIGLGMAQLITAVWYHPRPFEIGLGRQLLDHAAEASFPSDHATLLFGLAIPLLRTAASRRWGFALLSLGIGAAWSRIYLGVHFPLDMLGAFGVASLAALMSARSAPLLHRKLYPRLVLIYEAALCLLGRGADLVRTGQVSVRPSLKSPATGSYETPQSPANRALHRLNSSSHRVDQPPP